MAKNLAVSLNGVESSFGIASIDRSDLYGKRRRVALDPFGEPCVRVSMTLDGSMILRSGMTGQGYFLPDGSYLKQAQLEAYDAEGRKLEKNPSSLNSVSKLEGPVSPTELLDTKIGSIYVLEPETLDASLKSALDEGNIYSMFFSYRDSYTPERAFIFANKNGYFMLAGDPVQHEWVTLATVSALPVADEEDGDDLDFDML